MVLIKYASEKEIHRALDLLNKLYKDNIDYNNFSRKGKHFNVTLRVKDSSEKGARRGFQNRRKMINACWHVYGDFFDLLMDLNFEIVIISAGEQISYYSGTNWQDRNIGSLYEPLMYSQACECEQ